MPPRKASVSSLSNASRKRRSSKSKLDVLSINPKQAGVKKRTSGSVAHKFHLASKSNASGLKLRLPSLASLKQSTTPSDKNSSNYMGGASALLAITQGELQPDTALLSENKITSQSEEPTSNYSLVGILPSPSISYNRFPQPDFDKSSALPESNSPSSPEPSNPHDSAPKTSVSTRHEPVPLSSTLNPQDSTPKIPFVSTRHDPVPPASTHRSLQQRQDLPLLVPKGLADKVELCKFCNQPEHNGVFDFCKKPKRLASNLDEGDNPRYHKATITARLERNYRDVRKEVLTEEVLALQTQNEELKKTNQQLTEKNIAEVGEDSFDRDRTHVRKAINCAVQLIYPQIEDLKKFNDSLDRDKLEELRDELKNIKQIEAKANASNSEANEALQDELEDIRLDLQVAEEEIRRLRDELEKREVETMVNTHQSSSLAQERQTVEKRIKELVSQNASLQSETSQHQQRLDTETKNCEMLTKEYQKQLSDYQTKVNGLNSQNAELHSTYQSEIQNLKFENQNLQSKMSQNQHTIKVLETKVQDAEMLHQGKARELNSHNLLLQSENSRLNHRMALLDAPKEDCEKCNGLVQKCKILESNVSEDSSVVDKLLLKQMIQRDLFAEENIRLQNRNENLLEGNKRLESEYSNAAEKFNLELETMKGSLDRAWLERLRRYDEQLQERQELVESLQRDLDAARHNARRVTAENGRFSEGFPTYQMSPGASRINNTASSSMTRMPQAPVSSQYTSIGSGTEPRSHSVPFAQSGSHQPRINSPTEITIGTQKEKHGSLKNHRDRGGFIKKRKEQVRDPDLNIIKSKCRELDHRLLGIKTDKDVYRAVRDRNHMTPLSTADAFVNGDGGEQPTLEMFRPCWSDLNHTWNSILQELFVAKFIEENPEMAVHGPFVKAYFMQRLETMKRALGTSIHDTQGHLSHATLKKTKRSERRRRLWKRRLEFALDNRGTEERPNRHFHALWEMIDLLGAEGMSSDEDSQRHVGAVEVVRKEWRSTDVVRLLKWLDLNSQKITAYGLPKPGPQGRPRLRLPTGQVAVSLRQPIANLPINFYDKHWYNSLSVSKRDKLNAQPEMELPTYVLTWPSNESLPQDKFDQDEYRVW
ncbi:hypothetical protein K435DRAFT_919810 [Dendrothele bispora CBS 962.96]|uniref:Uncharacterized protein n=1 Tax=Dendrothele bispora (strain CBS 962.96) TaxID=1314807 RepID=A0A4S8LER4_DENBC|nr:hypothetical protein K435DRAFT_919810 [Dendrothele bispora CBS 962.96]